MKQNFINQIESRLTTIEEEAANKAVSNATIKKGIKEIKKFLESSITLLEKDDPFTEEEKVAYFNRINNLMYPFKVSTVSPKFLTSKKALATLALTVGLGTVAGIASVSMNGCQADDKEIVSEVNDENSEVIEQTTMDAEYKELADKIVLSMNDVISKGFEVTEENKYKMSKTYVQYYLLNQMDNLTDEQWANIFQNSIVTARDIMNAKESFEWMDEKRVTVSDLDMMLDYSYMFEGADLELLNNAKKLISEVNSSKDKKEAISNFKKYILDNLNNEDVRMQYSPRALDTFRAVYFDAFDTLTRGKEIDDELEHAINSVVACVISDNKLNVEDKSIKSLQSELQTYLLEKLEIRLNQGWNYVANNEVNPYNDINEISKYVANNIDITLYKELPDYEETLTKMFVTGGAEKSKNDSGVSNGTNGNIDINQFKEYGIDPSSPTAKADLEQKVEEETKKNESEKVTDQNGNVLSGTAEDAKKGYTDGYNAAVSGSSKPSYIGNGSYDSALDNGWSAGLAQKAESEKEADLENNIKQEYVPVEDGKVNITESNITTEDYTEIIPDDNYIDIEETFVPIDVSSVEKRIEQLKSFKNSLEKYVITDDNELVNTRQFTV